MNNPPTQTYFNNPKNLYGQDYIYNPNDFNINPEINMNEPNFTDTNNQFNNNIMKPQYLRSNNYNQFEKFIAQAMGIPVTNSGGSFTINKNSLLPIVSKVLANATIQDI